MSWLTIPTSILEEIYLEWISFQDLGSLDTALCNHNIRPHFLHSVQLPHLVFPGLREDINAWDNYIQWLNVRKISVKKISAKNCFAMSQIPNLHKVCAKLVHLQVQWFDCLTDKELFEKINGGLLPFSPTSLTLTSLSLPDCSNYPFLPQSLNITLLTTLNLQSSYNPLDEKFLVLLKHIKQLENLNINHSTIADYSILIEISRLCPKLKSFHLRDINFHNRSNEVVNEWIIHFENLASIDLSNCSKILSSDISLLIRGFTSLEELFLAKLMTSEIFQTICEVSPPLTALDFSNSSNAMNQFFFNQQQQQLQHQQQIQLNHGGNVQFHVLQQLPAPHQLIAPPPLPQNVLENQFRAFFPFFSNLKILNLSKNYVITDVHLIIIVENCCELTELNLTYCSRLTQDSFLAIGKCCRKLVKLHLSYCDLLNDFALATILENCIQMRELILTGCLLLTDYSLIQLVELSSFGISCEDLRILGVSGCHKFTEAGFYGLMASDLIRQLEVLDISDNEWVTTMLMEKFFSLWLKKLRKLCLGYCKWFSINSFNDERKELFYSWRLNQKTNLEITLDSILE
jgi:hypothetical protein